MCKVTEDQGTSRHNHLFPDGIRVFDYRNNRCRISA